MYMPNIPIRLAMGQMLVECGKVEANLRRAQSMIRRAAAADCRAIVLPECLDTGWTYPGAPALAHPIPGPTSDALRDCAIEAKLFVVAGITERDGARTYNAAILISPKGEILLKHRKINELEIAHHIYSTGTSVAVADTELGRIAVNICADNFPDSLHLARAQCHMGARALLSPCAWAVDADHDNTKDPYGALWIGAYRTLAHEYRIPIVGVSNVGWLTAGPWQGRKCIGCSLAIGPSGDILAQGPYGDAAEELTVIDLH